MQQNEQFVKQIQKDSYDLTLLESRVHDKDAELIHVVDDTKKHEQELQQRLQLIDAREHDFAQQRAMLQQKMDELASAQANWIRERDQTTR
jgi:predicted transcriptional regulator